MSFLEENKKKYTLILFIEFINELGPQYQDVIDLKIQKIGKFITREDAEKAAEVIVCATNNKNRLINVYHAIIEI